MATMKTDWRTLIQDADRLARLEFATDYATEHASVPLPGLDEWVMDVATLVQMLDDMTAPDDPGDTVEPGENPFVTLLEDAYLKHAALFDGYVRRADSHYTLYWAAGYWVRALTYVWLATGDAVWLERAMAMVEAIFKTARKPSPAYGIDAYGWTSATRGTSHEYSHDEFLGASKIALLLRAMQDRGEQLDWVQTQAEWLYVNLFRRWQQIGGGGNLVKDKAHLASELIVTMSHLMALLPEHAAEFAPYIARNIKTIITWKQQNPANPRGLAWRVRWSYDTPDKWIDTSHANLTVAAVVDAAVHGHNAALAELLTGMIESFHAIWNGDTVQPDLRRSIAAEGPYSQDDPGWHFHAGEWTLLGAWDPKILEAAQVYYQYESYPFVTLAAGAWAWAYAHGQLEEA